MSGPELTAEEQDLLRMGAGGKPDFFMPFSEPQALNLFVIHALRDMASQQRETAVALRDVKEQLVRWEAHISEIAELKETCEELKSERQQRAGMIMFVQWVGRYFPWIVSAAAAVWAIKGQAH